MTEANDKQPGPNPYAPPASKTGSKQDWKRSRGRSRVMVVLFVIVGLISLVPPLTLFSLFCAAIGFACLAIGRSDLVNPGLKGLSPKMFLLLPGFLLTGAVMFGGTCNAVVWPVVLKNSGPNWEFDWLYSFLGPHLMAGMIAGGVMVLLWIAWFVADARSERDSLQE